MTRKDWNRTRAHLTVALAAGAIACSSDGPFGIGQAPPDQEPLDPESAGGVGGVGGSPLVHDPPLESIAGAAGTGGLSTTISSGGASPVCATGETRCSDNDVEICNTDQTGYTYERTCSGNAPICDPLVEACVTTRLFFDCGTEDRWVDRTDTALNAQGGLYTASDSTAAPATGYSAVESVTTCESSIDVTLDIEPGGTDPWGVEIGLRLCEESNTDEAPGTIHPLGDCPLPGDQEAIRGVRFRFCPTSTPPNEVRVGFPERVGETGYVTLQDPTTSADYTVWMSQTEVAWQSSPTPTNPEEAVSVSWGVPTSAGVGKHRLCVMDVELLAFP